jgi:hypothetical protein
MKGYNTERESKTKAIRDREQEGAYQPDLRGPVTSWWVGALLIACYHKDG